MVRYVMIVTGAGTAAMKIEGIPEPASLVLAGVRSLFLRRRA